MKQLLAMSKRELHTSKQAFQRQLEALDRMREYCEEMTRCRRNLLVEHFGERPASERVCEEAGNVPCDNCERLCHVVSRQTSQPVSRQQSQPSQPSQPSHPMSQGVSSSQRSAFNSQRNSSRNTNHSQSSKRSYKTHCYSVCHKHNNNRWTLPDRPPRRPCHRCV